MTNTALIIGSGGQDGKLLTSLLVSKNYRIIGIRKGDVDLADRTLVKRLLRESEPSEIYFLAAHHHSAEMSVMDKQHEFLQSMLVHKTIPEIFLDLIFLNKIQTRFFFASSSHIFAPQQEGVQNEDTLYEPNSAYGISKLAGMKVCAQYRNLGVFASTGILYNHESPLRGESFVTKKIVKAAVRASRGAKEKLEIGNLDAEVDWGYAGDYVEGMWMILQAKKAADYIVATGQRHTVRDFAQTAFGMLNLDFNEHVIVNAQLVVGESACRIGDSSRLRRDTGWAPKKSFRELVACMVESELKMECKK